MSMPVIGIDFGNDSCIVAAAIGGGIETVDNDYSLRATPSAVAFGEKSRILGVPAKNQLVTNIKNTVVGFKRLFGRGFDDPYVQEEAKRMPFKIVPHPESGGIGVEVKYLGSEHIFSMEQVAGMLFTKLKQTTEKAIKMEIRDCVISVPSFFTDIERRALIDATKMAGLNVQRLLNDTAATSLTFGIYRQDLPDGDECTARNVVFVDCGHSSLQVWVTTFNNGKAKILACMSDPFLGGRDFDKVLADHFCSIFRSKYNLVPETNPRAYARLLTEVEKIKKQMSSNATNLPLSIECLMNDTDVTGTICRAEFEDLCAPLLKRVEIVMRNCFRKCKLGFSDIYSVQIVGGTTRIPAIKAVIEKVFGKFPATTLNQDEAVARGCALQCALLSPTNKLRDFKIIDIQQYPISIVWDESLDEDGRKDVFPLYHSFPCIQQLSFHKRGGSFKFKVMYRGDLPHSNKEIANCCIDNIPSLDGNTVPLKVYVRIDEDRICSITLVTASLKTDDEGVEYPHAQENGNGDHISEDHLEEHVACKTQQLETDDETPMSQDAYLNDKKMKMTVRLEEIPFTVSYVGCSAQAVEKMIENEGDLIANDKREKDRIDAKNDLEEYIYLLKDKMKEELAQFIEENEKTKLHEELGVLENWLYDEGSDLTRHVYCDQLASLKAKIDPISQRRDLHLAIETLETSIETAQFVANVNEPHSVEMQNFAKVIKEGQQWVLNAKTSPSTLTAPDVNAYRESFMNATGPVVNKLTVNSGPPRSEDLVELSDPETIELDNDTSDSYGMDIDDN